MKTLAVRRLEYQDLSTRVEWFNEPSVYGQMPVDIPFSLADTQEWFRRNLLTQRRRDFSFSVSNEDGTSRLGAMGGLVDIDHKHQRAELYIVVNPKLTRMGIGATAIQWLCNYGFNALNLQRIYLYTLAGNQGARRLYQRLGFVEEGVLRKHHFHDGQFVDRYIQGILKSDWELQPWCSRDSLVLNVPIG